MARSKSITWAAWAVVIGVVFGAWSVSLYVARAIGFGDGFKSGQKFEIEGSCSRARIVYRIYRCVPEEGLEKILNDACVDGTSKMAWEQQYNEPLRLEPLM